MPTEPLLHAATWSRLQTFLAVHQTGSVASAAEQLRVTPPAVSAAVGALEKALGVALFERSGRGLRPSDAGNVFADYARSLVGLVDEAGAAVQEADRGRLRVGAVATAGEFVLPGPMASFVRAFPLVEVSLTVLPRDDLFAAAAHHELDVVVAGRPPRGSGLRSRAARPNRLLVVGSRDSSDDARTATWLLAGSGSGTRETALALRLTGSASGKTLTLGTAGAVLAAAREGLGVALAHEVAVSAALADGTLVARPFAGTPLDRAWHLTTGDRPVAAARRVVRHLTDPALLGADAFHTRTGPRS